MSMGGLRGQKVAREGADGDEDGWVEDIAYASDRGTFVLLVRVGGRDGRRTELEVWHAGDVWLA
jgi:hypothetical protein